MKFSTHLKNLNRFYQYLAAFTANLGVVCSEMHYGWPSPSLPVLMSGTYIFQISSTEGSWLTVTPLIGAIVGATITGAIGDIFGRKTFIVFSSIPFILSWLMVAFASSSILMFMGRFLSGCADGLSFTIVPMYLGEIAEPKIRGLLASVCPVCIVFGILLINIIGSYLPINTAAFVSTLVPTALLCTFIWMPESPYYYIMKGKQADARRSLQKLRGLQDVETELNRISDAIEEQKKIKGSFLDLFTIKCNRKALLIALGLRGFQQLSGTMAITFYCKTIFLEAKDFMSPTVSTIIYFTIQLTLSAASSFIVDKSGRRPLLIASMLGTAITLFSNGIYLYIKNCTEIDVSGISFFPVASLLTYIVIFSLGMQTIPLLIMGEIFSPNVKAFALCIADIYFSVIVTIISKLFHYTNEELGMHIPFFAFSICCVFGLIWVIYCVPETKGKTLEDIQRYLKGEELIDQKEDLSLKITE